MSDEQLFGLGRGRIGSGLGKREGQRECLSAKLNGLWMLEENQVI